MAIVIGGGVIGLSTAYHLALNKFGPILLLEKGAVGDGSSNRAAGSLPACSGAMSAWPRGKSAWRASASG